MEASLSVKSINLGDGFRLELHDPIVDLPGQHRIVLVFIDETYFNIRVLFDPKAGITFTQNKNLKGEEFPLMRYKFKLVDFGPDWVELDYIGRT